MPTSDPIVDAARELMQRHPGLDVRRAYAMAIEADPDLYESRAPDGSQGSTDAQPAPVAHPGASAAGGLPGGPTAPGARHYSQLSRPERVEQLRKLGYGERQVAGRTYVEKFGGDAAGTYEVLS